MNNLFELASIAAIALVLSVGIYAFMRLRIEQERTLQKLIERGLSGDELRQAIGLPDRRSRDLRRGVLLIAIGIAWTTVTFFTGGSAWMMGFVPIVFGATLALLRVLDGEAR